ncbi:MAG: UbiA family prenyltransferase [Peptococcaceae bacterium]|nr:UbiA family prenyltransferase [Peptococcaceae bacterium]
MRLFPTLTWVGVTTFVGVSIAAKHSSWASLDYWAVFLVLNSGIVCHGLLAHSANDYVDWNTGTDRNSPGLFSGGSRVIPEGYLAFDSMWNGMGVASLLGLILMALLYLRIGSQALLGGAIAVFAALFYSLPPLMLAYHPVVAEWLAVVPALVACGWLANVSASGGQPLEAGDWLPMFITALVLVGHLMFHHLSDIEADLTATPPKFTTPAYFAALKWDPRYVPASYWLLVVALSIFTRMYVLGIACTIATAISLSVNLSHRRLLAQIDQVLLLGISVAIIIEILY